MSTSECGTASVGAEHANEANGRLDSPFPKNPVLECKTLNTQYEHSYPQHTVTALHLHHTHWPTRLGFTGSHTTSTGLHRAYTGHPLSTRPPLCLCGTGPTHSTNDGSPRCGSLAGQYLLGFRTAHSTLTLTPRYYQKDDTDPLELCSGVAQIFHSTITKGSIP